MELLEANVFEKPRIEVWQNDRIATPRTIQDETLRTLFPPKDARYVAHLSDSKGGVGYEVIRLKQAVDLGKLLGSKLESTTKVNGFQVYEVKNTKTWPRETERLAYWQPNPRMIAVRQVGEGWQKYPDSVLPAVRPTVDPHWRRAFEFVSGYGECNVSERYSGLNVKNCVVGTAKRDDGTLTAVFFPDSGKRSEWSSLLEKDLKYMTAEQDTTPGRREFMNAIGGTKRWGQGDVACVFKPK